MVRRYQEVRELLLYLLLLFLIGGIFIERVAFISEYKNTKNPLLYNSFKSFVLCLPSLKFKRRLIRPYYKYIKLLLFPTFTYYSSPKLKFVLDGFEIHVNIM